MFSFQPDHRVSVTIVLIVGLFCLLGSLTTVKGANSDRFQMKKSDGNQILKDPFADEEASQKEKFEFMDPLEEIPNRRIFAFNKFFFFNALQPVTRGYETVTTGEIRDKVRNFFQNLKEPVTVVNSLLQLQVKDAGASTIRFLVNTTVGIGGIFDPAENYVSRRKRTFDQTLAKWYIPAGPYLMYPVLGPTTVRGFAAGTAGVFLNPFTYAGSYVWIGSTALKQVNNNSYSGDDFADFFRYSVDPYIAAKDGFEQSKYQLYRR